MSIKVKIILSNIAMVLIPFICSIVLVVIMIGHRTSEIREQLPENEYWGRLFDKLVEVVSNTDPGLGSRPWPPLLTA